MTTIPDTLALAPSAIVVAHRHLDGWSSSPTELFDWLRGRVSARSLQTIASSDHIDHDKHLEAVTEIARTGLIPQPLAWHPRETLELTRWAKGTEVDHLARAFACTVLLIDAAGPTYRDGHEQTIPVLIESCLELGAETLAPLVCLLATVAEAYEACYTEMPFTLLGLLLAGAALDANDPRLASLAHRLIAHEEASDDVMVDPASWLLGRTRFDARHKLWRSLAAQLLVGPQHLVTINERLRR
jgi:hypothetical protein